MYIKIIKGTEEQKEAEYARFCFNKYLERKSLSEVANLCREKGYRRKRGKAPNAWTVSVILTRPQYCGYNSYLGQVYKGDFEPIISVAQYNRVQRLLIRQGKITGRPRVIPLTTIH